MITSTSSSQVKHVMSLLSKAKERKKNNEYVVEGIRMVSEVPEDSLVKIYMSERFQNNNPEYARELLRKQGITADMIEIVADNVFDRMSQTQTPQGIMAVVKMKNNSLSDMLAGNPLLDTSRESAGSRQSRNYIKNGRGCRSHRSCHEF